MAWNVKKEMPIGSSTRGTTTGRTPSTRNSVLTLSAKKFAYLKIPSTTRLTVTAPPTSVRAADVPRRRSTAMAIV